MAIASRNFIYFTDFNDLHKKIQNIYTERDASDFDHRKWLEPELSTECITFAAKDVFASIEIHKRITS